MATTSNDGLRKLIEERGRVKAALTRFKNFYDTNGRTTAVDSLQERLNKNVLLFDRFESLQDQIEKIVAGSPDEEIHCQFRDTFESMYFDLVGAIRSYIQRVQTPVPNLDVQSDARLASSSPATSASSSTVKLPAVPVPNFSGCISEWVYFRDSFDSMINRNESLSNMDRFHYLKSALKGEAARAIKSLAMSEENYTSAWKLLRERYEDANELKDHHVGALFSLPAMSKDSAVALRQLLDDFNNNLKSLKSLNEPVESWDTLLIHILVNKLDARTMESWDRRVSELSHPKRLEDLTTFLEKHCKVLAKSGRGKPSGLSALSNEYNTQRSRSRAVALLGTESPLKCPLCTANHKITQCSEFKSLTPEARFAKVKELRVCFNCLCPGHGSKSCNRGSCHKCKGKHHTLLHIAKEPVPNSNLATEEISEPISSQSLIANAVDGEEYTFLSTAIVLIIDEKGVKHECRALLDSGSQINVITESFAKRLRVKWESKPTGISGIGASELFAQVKGKTQICVASRYTGYRANITCRVMNRITSAIPNFPVAKVCFDIPAHMRLADPQFHIPREVDLLIGNGHLFNIMSVGQHRLGRGLPVLLKTQFGWVLGGRFRNAARSIPPICALISNDELHAQLTRFWETEEVKITDKSNDHPCEEHFLRTVSRNKDGRYVVSIPFTNDLKDLGDSYNMAERRLLSLERRLAKLPLLKQEYISFMREYIRLGHMSEVSLDNPATVAPRYYLPHHAVNKLSSTTTKVRVVFDASAKTTSGLSLNDVQRVGPCVQDELFDILIRFRQHRIVLSADIEKMYRQILVTPEQRRFQCILWREEVDQDLKTYQLNTVTYGTASAPYLATRVLKHIGETHIKTHPIVSRVISHDFYVDDLLSGADTVEEAKAIKIQLGKMLYKCGMNLTKWASNERSLIEPTATHSKSIGPTAEKDPKTLGLLWEPTSDTLKFVINNHIDARVTKRTIVSEVAKIFDPLGLLAPVIVRAKMMIQRVVGETRLTYEELYTVLTQIEACMNSRPLSPVSADPTDLNPLTPGHFLTGGPLTDIQHPDVTDLPTNRLSRFQLLQAIYQHFWKHWQNEYLHQLQQRNKWMVSVPSRLTVDTMVVIKEDNLPPLRWKLGRITAIHPGKDNVTRVVSVRTEDGVVRRPVQKICILPMEEEEPRHTQERTGNSSQIHLEPGGRAGSGAMEELVTPAEI